MLEAPSLDAVVIGAGVVGLAVGRELARAGREVVVLEAEASIGSHTSSRNSEVIHAGIYYAKGSLKAELCVRGRRALYAYCEENGVAHRRLGKLIVAARDEEVPVLAGLKDQAEANGVDDLCWLTGAEVRELEPQVVCARGLFSPSTGIIDSHGFMAALTRDLNRAGAHVALRAPLLEGRVVDHGFELSIGGADPIRVGCRTLVNCAGLFAQRVAHSLQGVPKTTIPECYYAKGHYFVMSGKSPFSHLVYPVPEPGGLGIHVTLDLAGQPRFGPDVSFVDSVDYGFDETRAASFHSAIRRYFPELDAARLSPGYTGIRPKLGPAGAPAQDFLIQGRESHGVPGLVQLFGIESPGLTAALAVASRVRALLGG
jgi:L-2-hydroxyglutarate oxidase LhgO